MILEIAFYAIGGLIAFYLGNRAAIKVFKWYAKKRGIELAKDN